MDSSSNDREITGKILEIINQKRPSSVKQLVNLSKESIDLPEKKIFEYVLKLRADGLISLKDQNLASENWSTGDEPDTLWFKIVIAIGAVAAVAALFVPSDLFPWAYARNVLGVIFTLFLPGFTFGKAFFPKTFDEGASKDLEKIQRIVLSIGLSIALVSITSLALYYSPFGLNLATMVLTIFALTLGLAFVGIYRSQQDKSRYE